jgi:hypothetical protein
MKRRYLIGALFAAAAMVSIPVSAFAQLPPSPPVALFYGKVTGGTVGQGVVAIVINGGVSTVCGTGTVVDSSGPVYAVDILSDSQIRGCGLAGRSVQFYLTPTSNAGGRLAAETATIPNTFQAKLQDLTLGPQLTNRLFVPQAASDRTN